MHVKIYFKNIINNSLLFIIMILAYNISMPLLFSGFNIDYSLEIFSNLFKDFLTLEIFNEKFFVGVLIFLVGVHAIFINYLSKKIMRKINFVFLPIFAIVLVLFFSFIHAIFYEDGGDMEGFALAIYMGGAIILQIIFSIIISIFRIFKNIRKSY